MWYWVILFLVGISIGSFLNVVSLRYSSRYSVFSLKNNGGRSRCPHCHKTLRWFELIPLLSFLVQGGKCRNCIKSLSFQYPFVEVLSGLLFVFIPWYIFVSRAPFIGFVNGIDPYIETGLYLFVFSVLFLVALIDYHYHLIPNELNILLICAGVLEIIFYEYRGIFQTMQYGVGPYSLIFNGQSSIYINRLVAMMFGAIITGIPVFLSHGRVMGLGDFKFAIALGLVFGWPTVIFIIFGAFIIGSCVGIILMIAGKKKFRSMLAFGHFLALSAFIFFFWGEELLRGYFGLLSP